MKNILFLAVFLLYFSSCTAQRVITQIIPEATEGTFAMGREYIPLESDQIEVELGYDGMQGENLVFDFVVHNSTTDTISVLPANFYYVLLDSADADPSSELAWSAVHPDTVLLHYDRTLEERKQVKDINSFMGILRAGAGILYNASAYFATDNPGFLADAFIQTVGTAGHYIAQDQIISEELEMISEEKDIVREEIFRECNILPGSVVSGYIFFPKNNNTAYYMFCFPIEDQQFQFVYNQKQSIVAN